MTDQEVDDLLKKGLTITCANFLLWAWHGKPLPDDDYTYKEATLIIQTIEDDPSILKKEGAFELVAKCRKIILKSPEHPKGISDEFVKSKAGKQFFKSMEKLDVKTLHRMDRDLDKLLHEQEMRKRS